MKGGVGAKIRRQISIWKYMGHDVKLFCLTPEHIPVPDSVQFIFKPSIYLPFFKELTLEISRSIKLSRMLHAIKIYQPDMIYFRFGLFTFPLHKMFKIAPVFMEVNSNDVEEYKTRGVFFYLLNRITREIVFRRSAGLLPVSQEIAELNKKYNRPTCVVSNGIDLDAFTPLPATKNKTPVLSALGSPGNWQGMDKLFHLARKFPDLTIYIIGDSPHDFSETIPDNLHICGFLSRNEIREIFSNTDAVFSQLALHRKNMNENPTLKVREALAYGLPLILAHQDADLVDLETDYILRIPNTEDNLLTHGDVVRDFAYRVIGKRIERELVTPRIDQRKKEQKRLAFFQEVLAKQK
jgi:glycosyltransferase involved in cell wall biosynthesis